MRIRHYLLSLGLAVLALGLVLVACAGPGFDPQSKVNSVRMFGVRPDKPYAAPGETVTLEVLATDGRREKPRPMKIFWIPIVCTNPPEDLYYLCFLPSQTADGQPIDGGTRLVPPFPSDGGTEVDGGVSAGGGISSIPTGIDLGPLLPQGPTFSFRMPDDIVQPRVGGPPYGLAIVFNIACAGQLRFAERTGSSPQQIPIQCTDEQGNQLSPDDYVIGINRVYSYADRTNTNPVIEGVTLQPVPREISMWAPLEGLEAAPVDLAKGITIDRCAGVKHRVDCPAVKIDVRVSDSSWEPNPGEGAGANQREQIWATYYSDVGQLEDDARLLFDSTKGRVSESGVKFRAPSDQAAEGTLWVVVHDNRAGAAFVQVPIHIK